MTMPYCLLRQDTCEDYWMALRVEGVEPGDLRRGVPLEVLPSSVHVSIAAHGEGFSDFLEFPCPVVSDRVRRALDDLGIDNVQYVPAVLHIEYIDEPLDGYWLANVIGLVRCVDAQRSSFKPVHGSETKQLLGFEIDPAESLGLRVFRLAEDPGLLVLCDNVRQALAELPLRGVFFQDTCSYDGGPASSEPLDDDV